MNNNDLMNMLMGTLSNPQAKDKLMGLMSSLGAGGGKEAPPEAQDTENNIPVQNEIPAAYEIKPTQSPPEFMSPEMISKIKGMLDNFNRVDDTRIGLLNSIKPYMKSGRAKNVDMAIKFIQFINFASGFNNNQG